MARHRKQRARRRIVRPGIRLAWRGLTLAARVLVWSVAALVWAALVVTLVTLAAAGGREAEGLRRAIVAHLLTPVAERFRKTGPEEPADAEMPAPPAVRPVDACAPLPRVIDPDPALWPPMGQLTDTSDEESIGIRAMRGLAARA